MIFSLFTFAETTGQKENVNETSEPKQDTENSNSKQTTKEKKKKKKFRVPKTKKGFRKNADKRKPKTSWNRICCQIKLGLDSQLLFFPAIGISVHPQTPMEQSKYPQPSRDSHCSLDLSHMCSYPPLKNASFSWCFRQVQSPNDVMLKIEKRLNNTQTTTQK